LLIEIQENERQTQRFRCDSVSCIIAPPLFGKQKELRLLDDLKATDARLRRHKLYCFRLYQISHLPVKENLWDGWDVKRDTYTALYYCNRFGNLELPYRDPVISCMYPIPFARRSAPPEIPPTLEVNLSNEGEFVLVDMQQKFS